MVELANGPAVLLSATVAMGDWALEPDHSGSLGGTPGGSQIWAAGFTIPLTLSLYGIGAGDSVGPLIGSYTLDARASRLGADRHRAAGPSPPHRHAYRGRIVSAFKYGRRASGTTTLPSFR